MSARVMYNYLSSNVNIVKVVIENPISIKRKIRFKMRKFGLLKTIGQLMFVVLNKVLKKFNKRRLNEVLTKNKMSDSDFPVDLTVRVNSINSKQTKELIEKAKIDFILVAGTRIISKSILDCTCVPFINIHAGITPQYRGVHGGYWALINNDLARCGVTIHYVDKGVDTGKIIAQSIIEPTKHDSFCTYPVLQLASALPILKELLNNGNHDTTLESSKSTNLTISKQWYHPTIWFYLYHRFLKGIK
jgi:methionyl-tRNA formyltransferase